MKRVWGYTVSSFLTATGGYFFIQTPAPDFLPDFKKFPSEKKINSLSLENTDDSFPRLSMISVDKYGNILITDRETQARKIISPNGIVKNISSGEGYEFSSTFGPAPMEAGMGWGAGSAYGGFGGYGTYNSNGLGSAESQAQAISIKKAKGQVPTEEETHTKDSPSRDLASESLGGSGGLGSSGNIGRGLMGGGPFAAPSSATNQRASAESPRLSMVSSDLWGKPEKAPSVEVPSSSTPSQPSSTDTVSFQEAPPSEDSKSTEPQYVTVPGAKKASNQKSAASAAPQAPDRRQNAKKAEDSANNAIPPIMNNANEEKKKADEEREKQNYQKAQEHDAKAAMLMAQAAAMAAAAAGNNNSKNKAGNDSGGGNSAPVMQTPLIFNYGDNQPKSESKEENNQPQVIAVYPNQENGNKNSTTGSGTLQNSGEIVLADPGAIK